MKKTGMMLLVVSILLIACTATGQDAVNQAEPQSDGGLTINSNQNLEIVQILMEKSQVDMGQVRILINQPSLFSRRFGAFPAEIEGIKSCCREEKLARDVYLYLADFWRYEYIC